MNLLVITGKMVPAIGNNANLLGTLLPYLAQENTIHLLSETTVARDDKSLRSSVFGQPICWACHDSVSIQKRKVYSLLSSIADRNSCSDAIQVLYTKDRANSLRREYYFDAVISTMEPYYAPLVSAKLPHTKRILYIMDPPISFVKDVKTPYRTRNLKTILAKHDVILTTPFIRQAFREHGFDQFDEKFFSVGFPLINPHEKSNSKKEDGKIRLLYSGWLYSDIRSPRYFLDIVTRLDERFEVTFMGRECELLQERFPIETRAKLITLPNQPYEVALQAMADADVLINIGNSVPVHMPSKTLEYINTGKPMVNFYKFADCPTLYYTERYPLALNLYEEESDIDTVVERFIRFCEESIGKMVERKFIESEYADCTPQYIAQKILDCLET